MRFAVYEQPGKTYLLDVQADTLAHLNTRVVIPLALKADTPPPLRILNPSVEIDGRMYLLMPQYIAAVPASLLKVKVLDLAARRDEITAALDLLFQGF